MNNNEMRLWGLVAPADGWEKRNYINAAQEREGTEMYHKASGLSLRAWGAAGIGVSLWSREGERIAACYHQLGGLDGLVDAMVTMLGPIVEALSSVLATAKAVQSKAETSDDNKEVTQ